MSRWRRDWRTVRKLCGCGELGGMAAESHSLFMLEKTSGHVVGAQRGCRCRRRKVGQESSRDQEGPLAQAPSPPTASRGLVPAT